MRKPADVFHSNIGINSVKSEGSKVLVKFVWQVKYGKGLAHVRMDGTLVAIEPPTTVAKIKAEWSKKKSLPPSFSSEAVNAIHYYCTVNSGFVARPINLVPPYQVPPLHEVK